MATHRPSIRAPKIVELATQLETDIRDKKLVPGDPYLSAHQAARLLSVSTGAANRALQLLVKRDVLSRRQRLGTFIATPSDQPQSFAIDCVQMLAHQNFLKAEGLLADGVVLGIQEELPRTDIKLNFLPANDEGEYTTKIVAEVLGSARMQGFVLVRAPLEVQRIIQSSGLPAVIYGTPFPSITTVPWIERNQYEAGRLAAGRLIRHGFRSLTVVTRERSLPGDYGLLDGVRDEMNSARLPINHMTLRPLPADIEAVRFAVQDLLRANPSPQGFICRSRPLAEGASEAILAEGLKLNIDAGVVLLDAYQVTTKHAPQYPYLFPVMDPEFIGRRIGQMLAVQAQGGRPEPDHEIVAVELREPAPRAP